MWIESTQKPEIGRRIVAISNDGSDTALFFVGASNEFTDSDGEVYELILSDEFARYAYLPDDYLLWFERDDEDDEAASEAFETA